MMKVSTDLEMALAFSQCLCTALTQVKESSKNWQKILKNWIFQSLPPLYLYQDVL